MLRAAPPGHPLQKPTVVQWDIGGMLNADGAADESVSPQSGISRPGTDHLPYDFPGYAQLPTDRFDGLALLKKRAADLCNRLHDQHPNLGFLESWKPMWTLCSGVPIGSRSPRKGGPFCMPIHTCAAI